VDPATHTVRRIVQLKGVERTTTTFSDFRPVAGLIVPFQARESTGKSGEFWSLRSAASIEINVPRPARIFDPPPPALTEVQFPEGRDSVTMDFRFIDNEIYLPVSVNGQPQQGFLFDTGSTNAIDTRKAQALGLKVEMAGAAYGGGPEPAPAGMTKVDRLEIGGLRMENQVLDTFIFPVNDGDAIEGTIGYELARRTVVEIDYAARRITFMKPRSFRPPAHATAVPFRFAASTEVLVAASVDGIRGDFLLDTGAALSLAVNHPFAQRNGLLRKYESGGEGEAAGVGGVSRTVVFDPSQFAIGSLRPRVSEATISLADSGSAVQEHVAGAIGNPILKQFVLTLDYAHRMVYFEKNAAFGKPDAGDDSKPQTIAISRAGEGWLGIVKLSRRPGLPVEILELDADSAAARAGILKGDFIVAIDGTPVEKLTALQVGTAIANPGAAIRMTIKHGSETREVAIR
jgi:predicted aspartyl protease